MIRVAPPSVPEDFDRNVRQPGLTFLAQNPRPTNALWKKHRYWMHVHQELYESLSGICSYCSSFTPRTSGNSGLDHTSIDHFTPKSRDHILAYEWSNYRLCRSRLNNRKGDHSDVIDPYITENGKFRLNFKTFYVVPDASASHREKQQIEESINRLELNDDESYINERARVVYAYADKSMDINT